MNTDKIDAFAKELGLELIAASPINSASYGNVRPLMAEEVRRYEWPAKNNGGRYSHFLLVTLYSDGSFASYLEGERGNEPELRRMVAVMETRPTPAHQAA